MTVRWLLHVSDVHFTMQDRNDEYQRVWSRMCAWMRNHVVQTRSAGKTLIVCTGDLFHEKTQLSSRVVELATRCMRELCQIAPVILITGNHDFLQQNPAICDSIQAVCGEGFHPNLHYLRTSGCYEFENVGFGVLSVLDALRVASHGRNPDAVFPAPAFSPRVRHKVALFHGTIQTSRFFQGYRAPEGHDAFFPVDMFKGYDLALLGDNHRCQVHGRSNDIPPWGYAGSLLQQNFGEGLERGFLVWDLTTYTAQFQRIESDWAFITVRPSSAAAEKEPSLEWLPSPDARAWFPVTRDQVAAWPPHLQIRALVSRTTHDVYQETASCLRPLLSPEQQIERLVLVRATGEAPRRADADGEGDGARPDDDVTSGNTGTPVPPDVFPDVIGWVTAKLREHCPDHLEKATTWFRDPSLLVPWELLREDEEHSRSVAYKRDMLELFAKAQGVLGVSAGDRLPSVQWRMLRLEWDNILCYGRGNVLALDQPGLWLVRGENGRGKSSLLDVLCLALFRAPLRERGRSLIHLLRRGERELQVRCDIAVNGVVYRIERKGTRVMRAGKETLVMQDAMWEVGPEGSLRALVAGESDEEQNRNEQRMETLIQRLVGTKEDFLTTVLMPQFEIDPFLRRTPADQRSLLQKWLRLDDAEHLHAFFQKCEKGWSNLRIRASARLKDARDRIDASMREHPWLENTQGTMHPERARTMARLDAARQQAQHACDELLMQGIHAKLLYPTLEAHEEALRTLQAEEAAGQQEERPRVPDDAERVLQEEADAQRMVALLTQELGPVDEAEDAPLPDPSLEWDPLADIQKQRKKVRKELEAVEEERSTLEARKPRGAVDYAAEDHAAWKARTEQEALRFSGKTPELLKGRCDELDRQLQQRSRLEAEVATLTKATAQPPACNHDCWACRQNPAVVRHQEMLQQREKNMLELMGLPTRETLENERESWGEYERWHRQCETEKRAWEAQVSQAATLADWQRAWDQLEPRYKELRKEKKRLQKGIDAWDAWNRVQKRRLRDDWGHKVEALTPRVQEIQRAQKACAEWDARRQVWASRREEIERSMRRWHWTQTHAEVVRLQAEHAQEVREGAREEEIHRQYHQSVQERESLTTQMQTMLENLEALGWVLRFLGSDKTDSYVQGVMGRVLPWLVDRVHEWIGDAADFRLGLVPSLDGKGPGGLEFVLVQPSTGTQVPVSMASGYQQFLLGLCVRMALLQLSSHRCQHMFLDEGFTACDQTNLHRMPAFLRRVRTEFHSILLISHLDVIAHAADRLVPIDEAPEGGSQLALGNRRTPVMAPTPSPTPKEAGPSVPYARKTVAQLHSLCQERGIPVLSKAKKQEIIDALEAADRLAVPTN